MVRINSALLKRNLFLLLVVASLLSPLQISAAEIFDTNLGQYNGVAAYSNGSTSYVSGQSNYSNGTYTGMKWQCVEYVRRYYLTVVNKNLYTGLSMNANEFYNRSSEMGLTRYVNGGSTAPQVGDILVSNGGSYGHVAIVRSVSSNEVCTIQQNFSNDFNDITRCLTLSESSGYFSIGNFSSSYPVHGWLRSSGESSGGGTDVVIDSLSSSLFPFIYSNVNVKNNGSAVLDLIKNDFEVYENGVLQTGFFEVTPPATSGGVRLADIVFLIDVSGSMGGEIADVRANVNAFANALDTSNIDFRLGLVRFGNRSGANPYIFNSGNLTNDVALYQSFVNTLGASGGYEPGFYAIRMAMTGFNFRPGAQKVFILITDEDSDDRNKQSTIDMLLANSITVHSAVNCGFGYSRSDYCDDSSIRGVTGGLLFGVRDAYGPIFDTIVETSSSSYVVRYKSSNPNFDGTLRTVEIFATAFGTTDFDIATYIPGAAPKITLTSDTKSLFSNPPVESTILSVSALITDNISPNVSWAKLHYKLKNDPNFSSANMTNTSGDVWEANIPGSIVKYPGLKFYITASDGQTTSSLPQTDPATQPMNIAVLPNELPIISHNQPVIAIIGQPVEILAEIIDTTHNIASVVLKYRRKGQITYQEIGLSVGFQTFEFKQQIPADVVTSDGVEYFIEAIDDLGLSATFGTYDDPITLFVADEEIYKGSVPFIAPVTQPSDIGKLYIDTQFNLERPTVVIVHGWNNDENKTLPPWMTYMADFLFAEKKANIFLYDWLNQAATPLPPKETLMVEQGNYLANLIAETLPKKYSKSIHFIGHSAGARVAYAAVNNLKIPVDHLTLLDAFMFADCLDTVKEELPNIILTGLITLPHNAISKAMSICITSQFFNITPVTSAVFFDNYIAAVGSISSMNIGYLISSLFQGASALVVDELLPYPILLHEVPNDIKNLYYFKAASVSNLLHKPPVNWYMASMIDQLSLYNQGEYRNSHKYGFYWSPVFNNKRPNKNDISFLVGNEGYYDMFGSSQLITDVSVKVKEGVELAKELRDRIEEKAKQMGRSIKVKLVDSLENASGWVSDKADSLFHRIDGFKSWLLSYTKSPVSFYKDYLIPSDARLLGFSYEIIDADNGDTVEVFINDVPVYTIIAETKLGIDIVLSDWIDVGKWSGETVSLTFRINSFDGNPLVLKLYDIVFAQTGETEDIIKQDNDNDNMMDVWEIIYFGDTSKDGISDYDSDGLSNESELTYLTDPTKQDTDGDSYSDGEEINKGTNPLDSKDFPEIQGDFDSDGDIDRHDLNILLQDRNKRVIDSTCGTPCDLDGNGTITVLDARKLMLMCTRPRCATE